MPTQASQAALNGLRDLTMIKWYVIPLLAIVIYIYVTEMKKAKETGNWNAIFAGLTISHTSGIGGEIDRITPLWTAWLMGHMEVAKYLVDNNADINTKAVNGNTLLMDVFV